MKWRALVVGSFVLLFSSAVFSKTISPSPLKKFLLKRAFVRSIGLSDRSSKGRILSLAKYPVLDIYVNLSSLLRKSSHEMLTPGLVGSRWWKTYDVTLEALSKMATRDQILDLDALIASVKAQIPPKQTTVILKLERQWQFYRGKIQLRPGPMRSLEDLMSDLNSGLAVHLPTESEAPRSPPVFAEEAPTVGRREQAAVQIRPVDSKNDAGWFYRLSLTEKNDFLRDFWGKLKADLIDQDHVASSIVELEAMKAAYRDNLQGCPYIGFFGLPGNGKDWALRSWIDRIYNKPGAYKDHLFDVPVLRSKSDATTLTGASPSYIGSDILSDLIKFVVKHSGGRYKLTDRPSGNHRSEHVINNPEWKDTFASDTVLDGYESPSRGYIVLNEWHDWAYAANNYFLKKVLSEGKFTIMNPNGGLKELYVPLTVIVVSNHTTELLSSRDIHGNPVGPPMKREEMLRAWEKVNGDPDTIISSIKNAQARNSGRSDEEPGASPELLDRFDRGRTLAFKPYSAEALQQIASRLLEKFGAALAEPNSIFSKRKVVFSKNLIKFIQSYRYQAENNARPIKNWQQTLVESPVFRASLEGRIQLIPASTEVEIDSRSKEDGTASLVFIQKDVKGAVLSSVEEPIAYTERDRMRSPLTTEQILEQMKKGEEISKEVVGAEKIITKLGDSLLLSRERAQGFDDPDYPREAATIVATFGLSSTGKTVLAKAVTVAKFGSESYLVPIDLRQVSSIETLNQKIFGTKDSAGRVIPSEFMEAYNRHDGEMVVLLDEFSNVPKEIQTRLLDFLREPVVRTFADGKPRSMRKILFIVAGNATSKIYDRIPLELPEMVRQLAMEQVYETSAQNEAFILKMLKEDIVDPVIARIGMPNIFIVSPHTFGSIRQLTQHKLENVMKNFEPQEGRRSWDLRFQNRDTLIHWLETLETQGFIIAEQGASIDRYVKEFENQIRLSLLKNVVPVGAAVNILAPERVELEHNKTEIVSSLELSDGSQIPFKLQGKNVEKNPTETPEQIYFVDVHEAGHDLVGTALLKDFFESSRVTVIPGVAEINNEMIYYRGLASREPKARMTLWNSTVMRQLAVMFAGEVAETLVARGGTHDAGKSNDMQRATELARVAILNLGLSETWGRETVPQGMKMDDYIKNLSDERRDLLNSEVQHLLSEGRLLAKAVLLKNFSTVLLPLSNLLADKGDLQKKDLQDFYAGLQIDSNITADDLQKARDYQSPEEANPHSAHRELLSTIPLPPHIATVDELVPAIRKRAVEKIPISEKIRIRNPEVLAFEAKPDDHSPVRGNSECAKAARMVAEASRK